MCRTDYTIIALSCHTGKWGAERSMCAVLKKLKDLGFNVVLIINNNGPIEELLVEYKIEYFVHPLVDACTMYADKYTRNSIPQDESMWKLVTDSLIDNYYKLLNGLINDIRFIKDSYRHEKYSKEKDLRLLDFLKSKNIKPDLVYTNTIVPSSGITISTEYRVPHVVHIREITDSDFKFRFYGGKDTYLKKLNTNISKAICISDVVDNKFRPYFGGKTVRIYNGVTIAKTQYNACVHDTETIKLLFVGRLSKEKGIADILRYFTELRYGSIRLDIYGDGPLYALLQKFIIDNDLKNVQLKGFSDSVKVGDYDVAIMSSPNEAFGRTTVEYMMNALPVIGYIGGATPEIIIDGKTGFLYKTKKEFIDIIKTIINNKNLIQLLGKAAKERAQLYFTEDRYVDEVCSTLENVIKYGRS